MAFRPNKPVSEFTKRALKGIVEAVAQLTPLSATYLYSMLGNVHPDHLDYARDIHRALCIVASEHAADFRNLLEADKQEVAGARRGQTMSMRELRRGLLTESAQAITAIDECEVDEASDEDLSRWDVECGDVERKAQELRAHIRAIRKTREADTSKRLRKVK